MGDDGAGMQRNAVAGDAVCEALRHHRPGIDHGPHLDARRQEHFRRAIDAVVGAHHHGRAAGRRGIARQMAFHGGGEHHAGQVVAGEHERPLDGAGRQHHAAGMDRPVAVAGQVGIALGEGVLHPLHGTQHVAVVVAVDGGAGKKAHGVHARQLVDGPPHPGKRRRAVDGCPALVERAAEDRRLVGEQHPGAGPSGLDRRRQAGRPAANHKHVTEGVGLLVAALVGLGAGGAKARRTADEGLVEVPRLPARPHECLIIETSLKSR